MSLMRRVPVAATFLLLGVAVGLAQQQAGLSDEAGRVMALENAWNHAIESKDAKALDMLMASTMVALGSDGSFLTKDQYLASIKAADFQPAQAVTEQGNVHMYGDTAVAVTVFRMKEIEKGKTVTHHERTVDTWVKIDGTWKCVAAVAVAIPSKPQSD
jgi:ketosteroid isomerase-like protein